MYGSEEELGKVIEKIFSDGEGPFNTYIVAHEFDYREGRTDMLASDEQGDLFAFELKLEKWRNALHQAYRNSSFAHFSYVVVPLNIAEKARKWEQEFKKRGVGLCSVNNSVVKVEIEAKRCIPLRPWLTESAINFIDDEGVRSI